MKMLDLGERVVVFDVAVVGLGPAGRSLASACLDRGLTVLAVDPRPETPPSATYGMWADELGTLPDAVVRHRITEPELRSHTRHPLGREYVVLDNTELWRALPVDGAQVRVERLDDAATTALQSQAKVVVDARGALPSGAPAMTDHDRLALQTAYGLVLPTAVAMPALQGAQALFMDWSTDWRDPNGGDARAEVASFLYAIPLDETCVLLEETCLAAAPGLPIELLKARLHQRLSARGIDEDARRNALAHETVWIPMRGRDQPPLPGTLAHGVAGRGGHQVTGYSVAHSLARSQWLADELAAGRVPRAIDPAQPSDLLREAGLNALLHLDPAGTLALFEAFGSLSSEQQRAFLSRRSTAPELLGAMWAMFASMPPRAKAALARATFTRPS